MSLRPNLLAPSVRQNPYPLYAELRRQPICQVDPDGVWAVSRHRDVIEVLNDPVRFSSVGLAQSFLPSWLENNPILEAMVMKDPPDHSRLRAVVIHAFSGPAIRKLEPHIRAIAAELSERAVELQSFNFVAEFSLIPGRVLALLLQIDEALCPRLVNWAEAVLSLPLSSPDEPRQAELRSSLMEMERYFSDLLTERRVSSEQAAGIIGDLLRAEQTGEMSRAEVLGFLFDLVPGIMETTVHLLGNTMIALARHPQIFSQVRAEPALIPKLIEEVMRYEPPGHTSLRTATVDTEVGGVRIPKGATLALLLAAALRDEEVYTDPDEFLLTRDRLSNLVFGHGIHFCIGATLARLESRLAFTELFSRISGFMLETPAVEWTQSLLSRGPVALPVRLFHP